MPRPGRLLACPSCARHIQPAEPHCPHCGAVVRQTDGSVQRTAAAILLGLTASVAACDGPIVAEPVYGAPATGGGGTVNTGGMGGGDQPVYGSPATGGGGSATTSGMGGTGGSGGSGGAGGAGGGMGGTGGGDVPVYGAAATGGGGSSSR